MSLGVCLPDLLARKAISQATFDRLRPVYDELVAQLEPRYGRTAAESMATERALDGMELEVARAKRQTLLQAKAQETWLMRMRAKALPSGALNPVHAHDAIVDLDRHRQAIRHQAYGLMDGLLAKFRRNLIGEVRDKSGLDDVVDELFGRASGSANARELAEAWTRVAEWLRSRFNAAGGSIGKLEGWSLPQRHDARLVREAGFAAWRDAVLPLLDRARMLDMATGLPLSDAKLELILTDMYAAIASDGWTRSTPGNAARSSMANSRRQHRVLHFAGPDEWRAYMDRFGGSNTAFDAMLSHVERMAHDIAAMERLGPNPDATIRWQGDWLEKTANEAGDQQAIDRVNGGRKQLQRLWGEYEGVNHRPESRRLAMGFSILRAQQTAAKLGGALLSVGGDYGTMLHTARFNGIPAMKAMGRYVALMNPRALEDRALAARLGLVSNEWTHGTAAQWRDTGEEFTHEITRRLAEGVLRLSGLTLHTEAAQMAFGMEMLANIVRMRDRSFGNLDPAFARLLQRYDINEARWDMLRAAPLREERGSDWLFPEDIAAHGDQKLADDVVRMIATEADYAVPMPDLRTRELTNRMGRGTWAGELWKSAFLFKGFPLTILNTHGRRMLEMTGGARWEYGLTLLALTTAGGALSLQLKELAKGRDPQDMTTPRFLGAAMMQGGGLGIFGDLLGSSTDRFGGGLARTLAGPMAQSVDNMARLTLGNAKRALDGDPETETSLRKDLVRAIEPEVPGLSLWYARLAYERLLGDMIDQWADPNHAEAIRRAEQYAREQGTAYWAAPGALTGGGEPLRAPDFGNAMGQPEAAPAP